MTPLPILEISAGDTAWVLASASLVLLMTPALAFFYGGMVRAKGVLNMLMMTVIPMATVAVLWILFGFSMAFGDAKGFSGNPFQYMGMHGVIGQEVGTIPMYAFAAFQSAFAIIAAALISGALVDRMKFGAYLAFITLWSIFVYSPVAHWVWDASGWLFNLGALDFAGGTVVHINAGVSALVAAKLLGPRLQSTRNSAIPHNIPFVLLGAGLLWFGWFGFNAGSALSANGSAGLAMLTTQVATAAAMLGWLCWERATGPEQASQLTAQLLAAATDRCVALGGWIDPISDPQMLPIPKPK